MTVNPLLMAVFKDATVLLGDLLMFLSHTRPPHIPHTLRGLQSGLLWGHISFQKSGRLLASQFWVTLALWTGAPSCCKT